MPNPKKNLGETKMKHKNAIQSKSLWDSASRFQNGMHLKNAPQTTTKGELVSAKLQYDSYIRMMREYYYNKHWC